MSKNLFCFVTNLHTCTHKNGTKLYRLVQKEHLHRTFGTISTTKNGTKPYNFTHLY